MIALIELFLIPTLRTLGVALVGQAVGFFILRKLGVHPGEALSLVLAFGGMGITVFLLQLFPKNLSWLMGLPFSKKQLAQIHYVINALIVLSVGASQLVLAAALCKIALNAEETARLQKALNVVQWVSLRGVNTLAGAWIAVLLAHLLCLSIFTPRTRPLSSAESKRMLKGTAIGAAILAVSAQFGVARGFLDTLNQPIIAICVVILILNLAPLKSLFHNLAMGTRQSNRYKAIAASLAVLQCVALFGLAEHDKNSGIASRVSQAAGLLGSFRGHVEDASLVRALETGTSQFYLGSIARLYREQHAQGLTIQNAIAFKSSDAQVAAVVEAFKPQDLRVAELFPLFVWLDRKPGDLLPMAKDALYHFIKTPLDAKQVEVLLDSPSRSGHELALVRARYFRSPELLEIITARLPKMDAHERSVAVDTLAVLKGNKDGAVRGRTVASGFYADPDCSQLTAKSLEAGENTVSESLLNVCLRKIALERDQRDYFSYWPRSIESQGWISWPLNDSMQHQAKYLLTPSAKH